MLKKSLEKEAAVHNAERVSKDNLQLQKQIERLAAEHLHCKSSIDQLREDRRAI
jgi:hypothetical protein